MKVRVENFQSIADQTLEIRGLTAITGPNNSGKSALIRAIRGVFQNTPGSSFVRHGASESRVTVTLDSGESVVWGKGRKPWYQINGQDPIYPGKEVPEEVASLLGVSSVLLGGEAVWPNIASQLVGQVFLLDRPPSVLAEAVSDVERVAKLNEALRTAESDKRALSASLKVRKADSEKLESAVRYFDGLNDVLSDIDSLKFLDSQIAKIRLQLKDAGGLSSRLGVSRKTLQTLRGVEGLSVPSADNVTSLVRQFVEVGALRTSLTSSRKVVVDLKGILNVPPLPQAPDLTPLVELARLRKVRTDLITSQSDLVRELASVEGLHSGNEAEIHSLLDSLGECPVCVRSV